MDVRRYKGSDCAVCDRFIGSSRICPYCGEISFVRPVHRFLRYASLVMSIVGLVFLYLFSAARDVPRIDVGDIGPRNNFARARIRGQVVGKAYVSRQSGRSSYLSFLVDDGTGELRVAAYSGVADELIAENRVPSPGRNVDVVGQITVSGGTRLRLRLQSASDLSVLPSDVAGSGRDGQ